MKTLIKIVSAMRTAQKRYFRTRLPSDLLAAREAEALVDRTLTELEIGPTLFDRLEDEHHQIDPTD
jgi:hypothetical protein